MPTYDIETAHGILEIDHPGNPEQAAKDLAPAVKGWVDKQDFFKNQTPPQDGPLNQFLTKSNPNALQPAVGEAVSLDNPAIKSKEDIEQAYSEPLINLPKPENTGVISGITRGVETVAESLTSPTNIALLASVEGAPAVIKGAAEAGFRAMMLKGGVEKISEALEPGKTPGQRAQALTEGGASLLLGGHPQSRVREPGTFNTVEASQEMLNRAATQKQLESLAPATAATVEPKPKGSPEILDGLQIARRKLLDNFNDQAPEVQAARQQAVDQIDTALLAHDKAAVNESAERTKQPAPPPEQQEPPTATEAPGSPPVQGGRSSLFSQALQEQAPLTAEVVKEAEPPAPENAQGLVQVQGPQGDWLNAEVVSRDGGTVQLRVDDPIRGPRTEFVQESELRSAPKEAAPATYDEAQKRIDAIEDKLEAQGVNVIHLIDPNEPGSDILLGHEDWKAMPPELVQAYKHRNAIGEAELNQSKAEISSSLKEAGLNESEIGRVMDHYGINPKKSDAVSQSIAGQYAVDIAKGDPIKQSEKVAYALAAERGEMFDELRDVSDRTKRDAAKSVLAIRRYFGIEKPVSLESKMVDNGKNLALSEQAKVIDELTQDLKDARDNGDEATAASLERVIGALRKRESGEPVHVADVFGEKQGDYTEALKNEASDDPAVADKAQTEREKLEEDLPQSLKDILYGREPERPKRSVKTEPGHPSEKETIGSVYESTFRGEKKWFVQESEKRGFGDSIHGTPEEASKSAALTIRQKADRAASLAKLENEKAISEKAKEEREDLGGFVDELSPMKRGGIVKQLTTRLNYRGTEMSRRDLIRRLVDEGRRVETEGKERVLINEKDEFLGEKILTKAGMDYAQWLIDRKKSPPAPMKKKNAGESGAVTLPTSVVQAARAAGESGRKFIEEDVKPFVVDGARNTVEAMRQIKSLVAPANVDEYSKSTAGIIRQNTAELARSHEVARRSLEKASKEFDKLSPADNLKIIDDIETGKVQPTKSLQDFSDTMRKAMDERVAQVRALGTGKLEQVIQNYFPHIWEDPKKATSVYAQIFGKKPLEGSKGFLKQRTIPTTADGIAQGLKPVSNNPVELTLMKLHEMDRYIMGQKIMAEMKEKGLAEFVRAMSKTPDGYVKIDDRVAQVVQMRPVVRADGTLGAPEMVVRGHYYAPEGAARVLNNYLSPGLRGIKAYDAFRWLGNTLNQAQLGLSAFHLGFVSMDSGVSKVALGLEHILSGSPLQGLKDIAQSPIAPITNMIRGNKMLEEYYKPGTQGAEIASLMDAAMKGGARATMDSFYKTDAWKNMTKAFRSGNVFGGVLRAPFAALDLTMKPVLEYAVPRMKMGMFADMARSELERIGPNASLEEKRAVMAKAWDSVDNRMGQLVYDNLFWNKSFKDSLMAAQRSVGWNLGTLRELGGGALDTAATPARALRAARGESPLGEKVVTHRMAYAMALPIVAGVLGAIYQKLHTGMLPGQNKDGTFGGDESALRDMFTPRTGQTTSQGEEERAQLPSYMKDVFAYSKHPVTTIANKASPAISAIAQMLNNKDFYGTQIINPADPLFQKAKDELTFVGKQFVPFSLQGASKRVGKDLETKAESFVGVTPASAELTRTPAHQAMMDAIMKRMPSGARTKEDQARYEVQKAIVEAGKNGTPLSQAIVEAKAKGVNFSVRQKANLKKSIRQDPRAIMFSHLTLDEAKKVYALGNKEEKVLFRPLINVKLRKVGEPSIKPR